MSTSKQILDERLAKGEISQTEYSELLSSINGDNNLNSLRSVNFIKFLWAAPIIIVAVFLYIYKNNIVIEELSSSAPLFGDATVSATLYNKGESKEYGYYVVLGGSDVKHCPGRIFISSGERRRIKFTCDALATYNGKMRLVTTTAN